MQFANTEKEPIWEMEQHVYVIALCIDERKTGKLRRRAHTKAILKTNTNVNIYEINVRRRSIDNLKFIEREY